MTNNKKSTTTNTLFYTASSHLSYFDNWIMFILVLLLLLLLLFYPLHRFTFETGNHTWRLSCISTRMQFNVVIVMTTTITTIIITRQQHQQQDIKHHGFVSFVIINVLYYLNLYLASLPNITTFTHFNLFSLHTNVNWVEESFQFEGFILNSFICLNNNLLKLLYFASNFSSENVEDFYLLKQYSSINFYIICQCICE